MRIQPGTRVRDTISGLVGTVTARTEYLFSTPQVKVDPRMLNEGKAIEGTWLDESRVEVVEDETRPGFDTGNGRERKSP